MRYLPLEQLSVKSQIFGPLIFSNSQFGIIYSYMILVLPITLQGNSWANQNEAAAKPDLSDAERQPSAVLITEGAQHTYQQHGAGGGVINHLLISLRRHQWLCIYWVSLVPILDGCSYSNSSVGFTFSSLVCNQILI